MRSLYAKLAAVLLGLFLITGVLLVGITRYAMEMYQQEVNQKLNRELAGHIAAEQPLLRGDRVDSAALEHVFHQVMVVNPSVEVYLLDPQGRILGYSAPPEKVKRKAVDIAPIERLLRADVRLPVVGDDPRDPGARKVFSAAALPGPDGPAGYVYVILAGEQYDSIAHMAREGYIPRLSLASVGASLLFALVAGLLLFAMLTRRLRRLTASVEAFQRGDFTDPISLPGPASDRDEIARLGHAFRDMSTRITQQMQRLKDTDRLRRELVAHVSHDLRTPLASVQGYLETLLLRHQHLTAAEQRQYLEIAARHSARLSRLVAELFELAKLDANETQLNREPFAVEELVQDVAQEFRLKAEAKHIRLETSPPAGTPFVSADIGLIERVLENLLENAIRHTPDSGRVRLDLAVADDRVTLRVSDTGEGIPADELERVFDRFYRGRHDSRSNADGAGLGLTIAKRILELHGSEIRIDSASGAGTAVSFDLPVFRAGPDARRGVTEK